MIIKVLIENNACQDKFCSEHGLSLFVERKGRRYLFDTGASGLFIKNADLLEVDISSIDAVFISHAHYDHTGGLVHFCEVNTKAPIYIHKKAFRNYFAKRPDGSIENIGLDLPEKYLSRIVMTEGTIDPFPGLTFFSEIKTNEFYSEANDVLLEKINGEFVPDRFEHEQNFVLETESGRPVLIAGCAHSGIVNIINRCIEAVGTVPEIVIGGFHLMIPSLNKMIPAEKVDAIADRLIPYSAKYYTGHCTGQEAFLRLRNKMGDQIESFSAGSVWEID